VLDVFDTEPIPANDPLWNVANLTITPHIAAPSHPADVVGIFLENLARFEQGDELLYEIDTQRGY
jgi:phosphoglycerate dehydrogenase-like enzyme